MLCGNPGQNSLPSCNCGHGRTARSDSLGRQAKRTAAAAEHSLWPGSETGAEFRKLAKESRYRLQNKPGAGMPLQLAAEKIEPEAKTCQRLAKENVCPFARSFESTGSDPCSASGFATSVTLRAVYQQHCDGSRGHERSVAWAEHRQA